MPATFFQTFDIYLPGASLHEDSRFYVKENAAIFKVSILSILINTCPQDA